MKIKEKLRKYCKYKGYSQSYFCGKIDVSAKFLATNGRVYSDVLPKIRKVFTDLNMDWVVYDDGEMIISHEENYRLAKEEDSKYNKIDFEKEYHNMVQQVVTVNNENRKLNKKIVSLLETNSSLKKDNTQVPH